MNLQRQYFVLAAMLAGAAAASLLMQTMALAAGPAERSAQSAASIPDFSGRWGRNAFNFEPTPSGPQPVMNLSRQPDSTGHYEGDTLVVDTIGIKPDRYAMVDRYGSPVTETLHVVERYRLIDGAEAKAAQERHEKTDGRLNAAPRQLDPDITKKGLQAFVTVEDPNVFTTAWSGYVTYRRMSSNMAWLEQVCAENPNEYYKDRWIGLP